MTFVKVDRKLRCVQELTRQHPEVFYLHDADDLETQSESDTLAVSERKITGIWNTSTMKKAEELTCAGKNIRSSDSGGTETVEGQMV